MGRRKTDTAGLKSFIEYLKSDICRRILTCFLAVVVVTTMMSVFVFYIQRKIALRYDEMYTSSTVVAKISALSGNLENSLLQYLLTKNTDSLESVHDNINQIERLSYDMAISLPTSQSAMMMRDIGNLSGGMINYTNLAVLAKINRQTGKCFEEYNSVCELNKYIKGRCGALSQLLAEENNARLADFSEKQRMFFVSALAMLVLLLCECIVYVVVYTGDMARPVVEMAAAAKQISAGNFAVPDVHSSASGEIKLMQSAFNSMKREIKKYVKQIQHRNDLEKALYIERADNAHMQLMLREAQYIALQTQIQPHFLFNTINTGMQIAYKEGADDTVEFFDNMSRLMRYNLRNAASPVTLDQEVEQVRRYLYLLQRRFGDAVEFGVDCKITEKAMKSVSIPCTILQPIVENSYVHGIRNLDRGGKIMVSVYSEMGRACVTVKDNGCGMPKDKLERLLCGGDQQNSEAHSMMSTGLGLKNVISRLKSFYGREDVISIKSKINEGFCVSLYLGECEEE